MRKLITIFLLGLLVGCGTPTPGPIGPPGPVGPPGPTPTPTPIPIPVPPPIIVFEVLGKKIAIKGEMKSEPKASLEEMRSALRATVAQLEGLAIKEIKFSRGE